MEANIPERSGLGDLIASVWEQALGAASNVEGDLKRAFTKIHLLAGWSQDEGLQQLRAMTERMVRQRQDIERRLEELTKRSLEMLSIPRRDATRQAATLLEALEKRVEALQK